MKDIALLFLGGGMLISTGMYFIATILDNERSRNIITELWFNFETHKIKPHKKKIIEAIGYFLESIYMKNNRISLKKVMLVTFISNVSFASYSMFQHSSSYTLFRILEFGEMAGFLFILIFSMIFTEVLSVILTKFFHKLSELYLSFFPILIDLLILLVILYILPMIYIQSIHTEWHSILSSNTNSPDVIKRLLDYGALWTFYNLTEITVFVYLFTPLLSSLIFIEHIELLAAGNVGYYLTLLLIIPVFSLCIPTVILLISSYSLYNKTTLKILSKIVESISSADMLIIKNISFISFTFFTGYAGYLSILK